MPQQLFFCTLSKREKSLRRFDSNSRAREKKKKKKRKNNKVLQRLTDGPHRHMDWWTFPAPLFRRI